MTKTNDDALSKVPEVTLLFWVIKIAATTLGETGGDAVSMSMNLGYLVATAIFAVIFLVAVGVADRREAVPSLPLLDDHHRDDDRRHDARRLRGSLARHRLRRRHGAPAGAAPRVARRLVSHARLGVGRHGELAQAEMFYWVTIMFSQTLGTALGDWTADTAGLGYVGGAASSARCWCSSSLRISGRRISRTLLFWAAFVLTRPLGAVVGDFLDKPVARAGSHSAVIPPPRSLLAFIVACIVVFPQRAARRGALTDRCTPRRRSGHELRKSQPLQLPSAMAAGATAILAKVGVQGVPSNLATAVRTAVVLVFAWGIVVVRGEAVGLRDLKGRTLAFLLLSGVATGLSWLAYFKALQLSPASRVAPIDKLSLPITIVLAWLTLGEPISLRLGIGIGLMVAGAVLTIGA